jgi:predicted DsbA family dithiol-disulfide isomerase
MQFRAVGPDIRVSTEEWVQVRDVQCPVCFAVYHLWSPIIETEQTEVAVHTDWLSQYLMNACPNHAKDIKTPDPTAEKCRTYWLEEARAQAIKEAEDAGLRGTERDAFIQERTEIYYAELLMRRVG